MPIIVPRRNVHPMGAMLFILGSACSSGTSAPSGNGASQSTGGILSQGGGAGTGAQAGTAVATGPSSYGGTTGSSGNGPGGMGAFNDIGGLGGSANGGVGTAGSAATGGHEAGGASTGMGGSGAAGQGASGGAAGSGGGSGAGGGGAAGQSAGCGRARTLQNGTISIMSGGASRKYILRVPDGYDSSHPYRLVLAYAWSGASASQVVSANYFTFATLDGKNTIFAAPDAANGAGSWSNGDVAFTDAILAQIEGDLCIDKSRVFATGFSFGGGMAMALACTRADVFRAVAFFSGADLTNSCPATLTKPIAYYASQASEDAGSLSTTSPITGERKQAQFAEVNGCMPEPSSTTFPGAGQPHTCTSYKGCSPGHPTEYCVFNGPHGWEPKDPGQSTSWNAPEAWRFITQF